MNQPKKIGLALGGGGAKGLAHIGIIRELERANIPISYIAGTSMGAVVGGVYAATRDILGLEEIFLNLSKNDVLPVSKILRKRDGLFRDKSIVYNIEALVRDVNMEDTKIPFRAIATDIEGGEQVILEKGSLIKAIEASAALPIAYRPVKLESRLLMDGGFSNPVPADVVRQMGADFVIAVNVSSRWQNIYNDPHPLHGAYAMLANALTVIENQIAKRVLPAADIVLEPLVFEFHWYSFEEAQLIISAGARELRMRLGEICEKSGYPEPSKTVFEKFVEFISPQL